MKAVILSIGQELVAGQTVDTNSAYLSRLLASRGIETLEHRTVGDDRELIAGAIADSIKLVPLVIVTGGLGPTEDDLTRFALGDVMEADLVCDELALEQIKGIFVRLDRRMTESNRVQAMIPRGARALPNRLGTAPGIHARVGGADIYIMPGVPSEMKEMFAICVEPHLPSGEGVLVHRILHTFGAGESDIGARIADLMSRDSNPLVGTTVAEGMVSIRVIAKSATMDGAEAIWRDVSSEIRRRLGPLVVGQDDETMSSVVGRLLRQRGETLASAESCTGGMMGQMVTAVPGSSEYYLGGIVSYSNDVKMRMLNVPADVLAQHGAVSEEVARLMACNCREALGSTWALSITGIAGPGGGTEQKPVGLVYAALAGPDGTSVERFIMPGERDIVRLRSALGSLNALRLRLIGA